MTQESKTTILLCSLLLLSACDKPMANEDIVKATKYCEENGLKTKMHYSVNEEVTAIQCEPKEPVCKQWEMQ